MTAINYPVIYHREYSRDLPKTFYLPQIPWNLYKKALAILPLFTLHPAYRAPLSLALCGTRMITHIRAIVMTRMNLETNNKTYELFHLCLTTAAFGLLFFHPSLSYTLTSCTDLISHMTESYALFLKGSSWKSAIAFSKGVIDGLFLASILYGSVEIVVLCATLQIILELYRSKEHYKKGEYFEGICQGLLALGHFRQAIPQYKLLRWKYETKPLLEGILRQNPQKFVYLDIPDEYIFSLLQYCGKNGVEPPPYFKPGMAGGHISVIAANEQAHTIKELGQKFSFRLSHVDSFPQGDKIIHLLGIVCPELEQIRIEKGLAPRLGGDHDFHITYGIERV